VSGREAGHAVSLGDRLQRVGGKAGVGSVAVAVLLVGGSLVADILRGQELFFELSGPLLCFLGGLLSFRRLLRLGPTRMARDENTIDGGTWDEDSAQYQEEQAESERKRVDLVLTHLGLWIVAVGVLVWGYGGLLLGLAL